MFARSAASPVQSQRKLIRGVVLTNCGATVPPVIAKRSIHFQTKLMMIETTSVGGVGGNLRRQSKSAGFYRQRLSVAPLSRFESGPALFEMGEWDG